MASPGAKDVQFGHWLPHMLFRSQGFGLVPVYRFILHPGQLASGGEAASGQLAPGGEDTPGYLAPHPGQLAPGGEDTLAWAACPLPQENLTELNA